MCHGTLLVSASKFQEAQKHKTCCGNASMCFCHALLLSALVTLNAIIDACRSCPQSTRNHSACTKESFCHRLHSVKAADAHPQVCVPNTVAGASPATPNFGVSHLFGIFQRGKKWLACNTHAAATPKPEAGSFLIFSFNSTSNGNTPPATSVLVKQPKYYALQKKFESSSPSS